MKLIDSSSWTQALRVKGDPTVKGRVAALLESKQAAWCQIVRLELARGANNDWDRQMLGYLFDHVDMLAISVPVWDRAVYLAQDLRANGITVPLPDLIVFVCAHVHRVEIEHNDKHFDLLETRYPNG